MGPHPAVAAVRLAVRRSIAALPPAAVVLVACSGGPDSVALAEAAAFEVPRAGLRLAGVTVDHRLQDGSGARAAEVAAYLAGIGCRPAETAAVTVGRLGGPEAAARDARYAAFDEVARRLGAATVLLGHTLDDQAETVLLGLARGSGVRSLSGMAPVAGLYRRPFLGLPRAVTETACRVLDRAVWHDPHNDDPAFTRVRVRRRALPTLETELGPGIAASLARTARLARDDADALDSWAEEAAATCAHPDGGLDVRALAALPPAIRRRIIRRAAIAAGSPAGALSAAHVEAMDTLVTGWHGQKPLDLPGSVCAYRHRGRLLWRSRRVRAVEPACRGGGPVGGVPAQPEQAAGAGTEIRGEASAVPRDEAVGCRGPNGTVSGGDGRGVLSAGARLLVAQPVGGMDAVHDGGAPGPAMP